MFYTYALYDISYIYIYTCVRYNAYSSYAKTCKNSKIMHIRSPKNANGSPVACQAHPPRRGRRDRHGRHLQQRQLRRHQAEELQTMGAAEVELQLLVM